ncbi:phosphomannomutase/phosphoglucomutase [Candidatus Woesearchaeota archaeon]|nr:phosphomannomutase/phosphoglucomutase [Candidatus Woesearchaeota archaeon]
MIKIAGIFKAYDIRGIFPDQLNEDIAYNIGRAFVVFLDVKEVLVGRDGRLSSPQLFEALAKGITDQGANVVDIGLCSTPMFYFAAAKAKSSIMVTASHNPKEYNGFKFCRENAIPISYDTGIKDVEEIVMKKEFPEAGEKGKITKKDVIGDFIKHNISFVKTDKKFKIVVDAGNGMGSFTFPKIFEKLSFEFIPMYCEMDFNFPNHEANPLKFETLKDLQKKVVEEKADLGLALDGDGDRCLLIDEKGNIISCDLTTALIGKQLLKTNPGARILYDLRSSKIVPEFVEANGGKATMCRVGHSFIKKQMRDEDALFAGELSGHFYYKDSFFTESSFATLAITLNMLAEENKQLSELIEPLKKYFQSGEINSEVDDKETKMKKLEEKYSDAEKILHLDGVSVYYKDWWFNVRASNTEPLLRLNLEADTKELMEEKRDEILKLIRD